MSVIIPSLPAASFSEISDLAESLKGVADQLQIDFVDGQFAPFVSWPFTEADPQAALAQLQEIAEMYELGFDCMLKQPEIYLDSFVEAGARRVVIHYGSTENYQEILGHARGVGYSLGLAFTNDDLYDEVAQLLPGFDYVQVMGIAKVGQQGQPFDERTIETVGKLRQQFSHLDITIDGSVNKDTILALKNAGANKFAPGSAISKASNPREAYLELLALVS